MSTPDPQRRSGRILVVEDSPEDFEATLRALRRAGVTEVVDHCEDGDEALDYLFHRARFGATTTSDHPDLVVLDLNLPGTDGREVLRTMKAHPATLSIPVVVLTTSDNEQDIEVCYRTGANSYLKKPVDLEQFLDAVRKLAEYWLRLAILPLNGTG